MLQIDQVCITNIIEVSTAKLTQFINLNVLATFLPQYTPNNEVSVQAELMPRLTKYANDKAFITSLYLVVTTELFEQKGFKRTKDDRRDEGVYTDLEAKTEILYRTLQALDRLYEAASRLMTGIGAPDPRSSRHL